MGFAGGMAGFTQCIATNPMEIVKIRMQVQGTLPADVPRKTTMEVVKELGIRGLYKGSAVTLMRDVPFSLIFFPSYAVLKDKLHVYKNPDNYKEVNPSIGTLLLA